MFNHQLVPLNSKKHISDSGENLDRMMESNWHGIWGKSQISYSDCLRRCLGSLFQIDILVLTILTTDERCCFFCNTRSGFQNGSISLAQLPNKVILTVGEGIPSLTYDLREAKAIEKKTELQLILFKLADKVAELTQELKGK